MSALTCYRVHRGVGIAAALCASLIGASTLYTKQHYVLDVIAGILLACLAYVVFLRNYPREKIPELDRRLRTGPRAGYHRNPRPGGRLLLGGIPVERRGLIPTMLALVKCVSRNRCKRTE